MFIQPDTHETYRVAFCIIAYVSAVSIITASQTGAVRNFHSGDRPLDAPIRDCSLRSLILVD